MKTKHKIILLIAIICLIFAVNYTKSITISEISGGMDITNYTSARAYYNIAPMVEDEEVELEGEELAELLKLLGEQNFSKSLTNLLPQGNKSHRVRDGDFHWGITLHTYKEVLSDGSSISGDILHISNFYGNLEIRFDGESCIYTVDNQQKWLKSVLDLISN